MLGLGLSLQPHAGQSLQDRVAGFSSAFYDYLLSDMFQNANGTTAVGANDPIGYLEDLSGYANAQQLTSTRRPLNTSGWLFDGTNDRLEGYLTSALTASSRYTVPDLVDSIAGKGFTCTGLTRDTSDNTFWYGNDGRNAGGDATYRPSLVHTTMAGVFIEEITLLAQFPSIQSVQGVAYDAVDDTLWFCSLNENLVRHVNMSGTSVSSFAFTGANGITINTTTAELIVTDGTNLRVYNKSGVQQSTFSAGSHVGGTIDQIYYDNATGLLYFTVDSSIGSFVVVMHLASRQIIRRWAVAEADAIEGIVISGSTMYINNDGYFHSGVVALNQTLLYTVTVPTFVQVTQATFYSVFSLPASASGTRPLFSLNGGSTDGGASIQVIGSSTTSLRVFVNSTIGTAQRSFVDFTALPDLTTRRSLVVEIDTTAKEVRLWINGVAYGGTKSIPNVAGGISTGLLIMGGEKGTGTHLAYTGRLAGVVDRFLTAGERVTLDALLATRVA